MSVIDLEKLAEASRARREALVQELGLEEKSNVVPIKTPAAQVGWHGKEPASREVKAVEPAVEAAPVEADHQAEELALPKVKIGHSTIKAEDTSAKSSQRDSGGKHQGRHRPPRKSWWRQMLDELPRPRREQPPANPPMVVSGNIRKALRMSESGLPKEDTALLGPESGLPREGMALPKSP